MEASRALTRVRGARRVLALGAEMVVGSGGAAVALGALGATPRWFARHLFYTYSVERPGELLATTLLRALGVLLGLVLLLFVRPRIGPWLRRSSRREILLDLARPAAAAVSALLVCEGILRLTFRDPREDRHMPADLWQPDPELGWSFAGGHQARVSLGGRQVEVAIDAEGRRVADRASVIDPSRPTLVVAGESMAMGWGLDFSDTFAARAGRRLGLQVVNVGVPAYGQGQTMLRLRRTLPRLGRVVAVVDCVLPVQLGRDLDPGRPRLARRADGTLVPASAASGPGSDLRLLWLWRRVGYHGDEPVALGAALARETAALVRAHGAAPLFVVPRSRRAGAGGGDDWFEQELFARQGLPFVGVTLEPADLLDGDPHPNPRGAARIAEAVVGSLRAQGVGPLPRPGGAP